MLLPGYIPATCHKNKIVTLLVAFMLYYRNMKYLLGVYLCALKVKMENFSKFVFSPRTKLQDSIT